jgi:CheY-like chemotaxis protein
MVNILIVEDSVHDIKRYKEFITPSEHVKLFCASSAEEVMPVIKDNKIDVFFLDVNLPGIDGFEFARKIRQLPGYFLSYIIFITGYSQNQLDVFKEFHCYDYIVKPFIKEEFSLKLDNLIG